MNKTFKGLAKLANRYIIEVKSDPFMTHAQKLEAIEFYKGTLQYIEKSDAKANIKRSKARL